VIVVLTLIKKNKKKNLLRTKMTKMKNLTRKSEPPRKSQLKKLPLKRSKRS